MAILTKPTITKGQANEFDLSKSELAAISKVVNDSYFSDQANWSKVVVEYKSAEGNQHKMVTFDASDESPKANFELSEKAKDDWEVQSVKIMDFDGGYLKLVRGDLTVEEFDIALSSVVDEGVDNGVDEGVDNGVDEGVGGSTPQAYQYFMIKPTSVSENESEGSADFIACTEIFADFGSGYEHITNATVSWQNAIGNVDDLINGITISDYPNGDLIYKEALDEDGIVFQFSEATTVYGFRYYAQTPAYPNDNIYNIPGDIEVLGSDDGVNFTLIKSFALDPLGMAGPTIEVYGQDWKKDDFDGTSKYVDLNLVDEGVDEGVDGDRFFMIRPTARQEGVPLGYGDIEGISCTEIFADFGSGYEQITNATVSWSGAMGALHELIDGNKEALGTQNLVYKEALDQNGIILEFAEAPTISGFRYYAEAKSGTPNIIRNIPSEIEVLSSSDGIIFTLIKSFQLDPVTITNGEIQSESDYGTDWKLEDGWAKYVDLDLTV